MRERPILFNGAMVRAILRGQKTQTRRIANKPIRHPDLGNPYTPGALVLEHEPQHVIDRACPYGQPGDRLWVRETWADDAEAQWEPQKRGTYYRADDGAEDIKADCDACGIPFVWRPSIHMHRWRSRITLEIIGVRVERLQDISEDDCWAEGIAEVDGVVDDVSILDLAKHMGRSFEDATPTFAALWESINDPGSWEKNPWVWVLEFRRIEGES